MTTKAKQKEKAEKESKKATKKAEEKKAMTPNEAKAELGKLIWTMATNLVHGGKLSAVDFKNYVLGTLFYRFISENLTKKVNALQAEISGEDFDYTTFDDKQALTAKEALVNAIGFFLLPSQLFCNVAKKARHNDNLNTDLTNLFRDIERSAENGPSEQDMKGLFSSFVTDAPGLGDTVKKRNALLADLLEAVQALKFDDYEASGVDVFGFCYEYLIQMYALNSGAKGGEFYTPATVSQLLARIAADGRKEVKKVYDPACGSGSLLLQFKNLLGVDKVREGFFGQEIRNDTYNMCRMNMFLHNIPFDKFDIRCEDVLLHPQHDSEQPFDVIVSNPPYSTDWPGDTDATLINDPRFSPAGVLAPNTKSDFAFTMHMLSYLATNGVAAILEFPGALYRSGKEQTIRRYLVKNNFVDTVIQLPPNLFFSTPIAVCLLVLKKGKKDNRVAFIDASNDFVHVGNKNELSPDNIERIFTAQQTKTEEEHFCHVVTNQEIEDMGYNLSVSQYVKTVQKKEEVDIVALNEELNQLVEQECTLRDEINRLIASDLKDL